MANLGAGLVGSTQESYPTVIDTFQTFENGASPAPDGPTRVDAEVLMDILRTLVNIETCLGARPNGLFGSVAARLNQFLPGGGGSPGVITFTGVTSLTIPGTLHNVGQGALLFKLYDQNIPAQALTPGSYTVSVDTATYDVTLGFSVPTSGYIAIGSTSPLWIQPFSATQSVSVLGSTHHLGTSDLIFQTYDTATPMAAIAPGGLTVQPGSPYNVVETFATTTSGSLVLSAGGPVYAVTFTNQQTLDIPGTTHRLGTRALLFQAYDNASPRNALDDPSVTVHPTSYNVHVDFGTPLSGRFVLMPATTLTGQDFDLRDAGIVGSTATRVRTIAGNLELTAGAGDHVYIKDKTGTTRLTLDALNGYLGLGTAAPTHQLQLSTDDAAKLSTSTWLTLSDERLKEQIRPFVDGLAVLMQIRPVLFRYSGLGGLPRSTVDHIGAVAQAVQPIAPYMVRSRRGRLTTEGPETDILELDAHPLPYLLINAIHEQQAEIAALRTRVATLEATLAAVQAPPVSPEPEQEGRA